MRGSELGPARFVSVPFGEEESLLSEVMVDSQSCAGGFPLNWTSDVPGAVTPGVLDAMFPCVKAWSLQILCLLPQLAVRCPARKPGG